MVAGYIQQNLPFQVRTHCTDNNENVEVVRYFDFSSGRAELPPEHGQESRGDSPAQGASGENQGNRDSAQARQARQLSI